MEQETESKGKDRFSDLPDDILIRILDLAGTPRKIIVQTSAFSRRWRHLWASVPIYCNYLKFCDQVPFTITDAAAAREVYDQQSKIVKSISTRLSRCPANSVINGFEFRGCLKTQLLHDWIDRLVKFRVRELDLKVGLVESDKLDLPQCLSECDSLKSLTLWSIIEDQPLEFPSSYVSLRTLRTLCLSNMIFSDGCGDQLFAGSAFPFLDYLNIDDCTGFTHLKVSCRNLKEVRVGGMRIHSLDISGTRLEILGFDNSIFTVKESWVHIFAPNLEFFYWENNENIGAENCSIQRFENLKSGRLYRLFSGMNWKEKARNAVYLLSLVSQVEDLYVGNQDTFPILSKIYLGGGLPFSFTKLKTLRVYTSLRKSEVAGVACLLKSSPVLHTLYFDMVYYCQLHDDADGNDYDDADGNDEGDADGNDEDDGDGNDGDYADGNDEADADDNDEDDADGNDEDDADGDGAYQFWESQAQTLSPVLCHLKVVKFKALKGSAIVEVARFLLEHGKNLEEMIMSPHFADDLPALNEQFEMIKGHPRASDDVKISCLETAD